MAKLRPTLGDLRGAIGGVVFQRGPAGTIVRRKTPGTHGQGSRILAAGQFNTTDFQAPGARKLALATASSVWGMLTNADRSPWTPWADEYRQDLTPGRDRGRQAFLSVYTWRLVNSITPTLWTPVTIPLPAALTSLAITYAGANLTLTFSPSPLPAQIALYVRVGKIQRGARTDRLDRTQRGALTPAATASPRVQAQSSLAATGQQINLWCAEVHRDTGISGVFRHFLVTRT